MATSKTIEQKVKQHNQIVNQHTKRSFADLNMKTKGLLRTAPEGYYFDICHLLVRK